MATLTITNLSATDKLNLGDFYVELAASGVLVTERAWVDVPRMKALMASVAAGAASLSIAYTADEIASGLGVGGSFPVVAAAVESGLTVIRKAFVAGGGGVPDDVIVYAVGDLPNGYRVVDAYAFVGTAVALSTLELNSQPASAGTLYATFSSATTGRKTDATLTSAIKLTNATTDGLYIYRSDNGVAGEVYLLCRAEA